MTSTLIMSLTRTVPAPSSVISSFTPSGTGVARQSQRPSRTVEEGTAPDPLLEQLRYYLTTDPEGKNYSDEKLQDILQNAINSSRGSTNLVHFLYLVSGDDIPPQNVPVSVSVEVRKLEFAFSFSIGDPAITCSGTIGGLFVPYKDKFEYV